MKLNKSLVLIVSCTISHLNAAINQQIEIRSTPSINSSDVRNIMHIQENGTQTYIANMADYSIVSAKRTQNGDITCAIKRNHQATNTPCSKSTFNELKDVFNQETARVAKAEQEISASVNAADQEIEHELQSLGW